MVTLFVFVIRAITQYFRAFTVFTNLSWRVSELPFVWDLFWWRVVLLFGVFGDMRATVFEVRSTEGKWPTRLLVRWLPVCRGLDRSDVAGVRARSGRAAVTAATGLERAMFDAEAGCHDSAWIGGADEVAAVSNMASLSSSLQNTHIFQGYSGTFDLYIWIYTVRSTTYCLTFSSLFCSKPD